MKLVSTEERWSPSLDDSDFEPSSSVFEKWTVISERNDKVMKKPDRFIVNKPPKETPHLATNSKEVSETDLFLLGAIEKLAYRLDFMEKRLQRTEKLLYEVIAGNSLDEKQEPCPEYFARYGGVCYHISSNQLNWKSASSMCRSLGSVLLEFENMEEKKILLASIQIEPSHQGKDYWTGGLNPGLLWIWGNSAKPIYSNSSQAADSKEIEGNGRCLLLGYQPPTRSYRYKGTDCSLRHYYICRYLENSTGRQLERLERKFRFDRNDTLV